MLTYIVLANLGPFRTFSRAALDTPVHPWKLLMLRQNLCVALNQTKIYQAKHGLIAIILADLNSQYQATCFASPLKRNVQKIIVIHSNDTPYCLKAKSRYFPHNKSTNFFPFDIDRVIRQTYTHICIYIYIYMHTYAHIYMHTYAYICTHMHTYAHICAHIYASTYIYTEIYIHSCIYA